MFQGVSTHCPAQFFNDMNRSFPPVRMTTKRNAVILTEWKDLYEMRKTAFRIHRHALI